MGTSLADVLRRFAPGYQQRYPMALLPSHQRAIRDILACHTRELGGHLWHCPECDKDVYVYHGCRNRHCPACHTTQTRQWLEDRQAELLPCPYFHLTATVPEGLRELFRANQKALYNLLTSLTARCVMTAESGRRRGSGGQESLLMSSVTRVTLVAMAPGPIQEFSGIADGLACQQADPTA